MTVTLKDKDLCAFNLFIDSDMSGQFVRIEPRADINDRTRDENYDICLTKSDVEDIIQVLTMLKDRML